MKTRGNLEEFEHSGGLLQIEVLGAGTTQLQVMSQENPVKWTPVGDPLGHGTHRDKVLAGVYRLEGSEEEVITRHQYLNISWAH